MGTLERWDGLGPGGPSPSLHNARQSLCGRRPLALISVKRTRKRRAIDSNARWRSAHVVCPAISRLPCRVLRILGAQEKFLRMHRAEQRANVL
jgi:hypothetical protein